MQSILQIHAEEKGSAETRFSPTEQLSDAVLIKAIVEGAAWAMEPLYQRYRRVLYALAYHIVLDHQVAEDLLQEVFLTVWRRASTYSAQEGGLSSWLLAIMNHRAIDYVRTRYRHSGLQQVTWEEIEQDERTAIPDVWEEVWYAIEYARVRESLLILPREQRIMIELAFFQEWTHSEIARAYHIPLGTVKSRIRSGLLHLKQELKRREIVTGQSSYL